MTDLIVPPEPAKLALKPLYTVKDMIEFHKDITIIIRDALEYGRDYGHVPGIEKPFLFKPGAELLCKIFGYTIVYSIVATEADHEIQREVTNKYGKKNSITGYYGYTIKCTLRQNGHSVGSAIGLCSTNEKKFQYSPADQRNTVLKMAQKRALVAVVLNSLGLSNRFSQDEETIIDIDTVSKPVAAAKKETSKGYDPHDKKHQDFLMKELETRQIPVDHWDTIGNKLSGKSFADLQAIIEEVIKG